MSRRSAISAASFLPTFPPDILQHDWEAIVSHENKYFQNIYYKDDKKAHAVPRHAAEALRRQANNVNIVLI